MGKYHFITSVEKDGKERILTSWKEKDDDLWADWIATECEIYKSSANDATYILSMSFILELQERLIGDNEVEMNYAKGTWIPLAIEEIEKGSTIYYSVDV
jgi:hypothetical protein